MPAQILAALVPSSALKTNPQGFWIHDLVTPTLAGFELITEEQARSSGRRCFAPSIGHHTRYFHSSHPPFPSPLLDLLLSTPPDQVPVEAFWPNAQRVLIVAVGEYSSFTAAARAAFAADLPKSRSYTKPWDWADRQIIQVG